MISLRSDRREALLTWRFGLVTVIAGLYAWIGFSAHGLGRVLGLAGAVLVLGALAVGGRSRPAAVVLLLLGALPLAVTTWWSLATPLLAVLAVALAWPPAVPNPT
jgi:hypothetical protein